MHDEMNSVSVGEARRDFGRVMKMADESGRAVIKDGDQARYVLIDLESSPVLDMTDDEKIDVVAARVLKRYKEAFLELAK